MKFCIKTIFGVFTLTFFLSVIQKLTAGFGLLHDQPFMACVIGGSCAYATPIGMPANTMVVGLGGYKFKDYVKSGLPLILVSFVICMILLPILFPFYP